MSGNSEIPPETILAYHDAEYCVFGMTPFTLRIGVVCDALLSVYRQYSVECAAYITACNPYGKLADCALNRVRQAELRQTLVDRGFACLDGEGRDPKGTWAVEPSVLIPGLSLEAAKDLGLSFEQNAVVWCSPDAMPQLVLLR
jgi:hypothetical protein